MRRRCSLDPCNEHPDAKCKLDCCNRGNGECIERLVKSDGSIVDQISCTSPPACPVPVGFPFEVAKSGASECTTSSDCSTERYCCQTGSTRVCHLKSGATGIPMRCKKWLSFKVIASFYFSFLASCPSSRPYTKCLVNPCQKYSCPMFPNAQCTNDNCGGCSAAFTNDDGTVLTPFDCS